MNVKDKIVEIIELLDEIDEYCSGLADMLSNYDSKLSDLYHLIEENKLKTNECYRVVQEMRKVLVERRKIKNDMLLMSVYNKEKEKLQSDKNRVFLKQSIFKKEREINDSIYKKRIYTDEEISEILEGARNDL